MEKILLDTDIGSDIDDAVCLAYLLAKPECQLMGITTVTGESDKRAMLASALCKVAKKDIPIFPGAQQPPMSLDQQPKAQQFKALESGKWEYDTDFPKFQAIEFMRKTIRDNPGEITLLTIGPLSNIALLFAADPEIPSLLKSIVMMCGAFDIKNTPYPIIEWNAVLDYYAARVVYRAPVKVHRSIGHDVTKKIRLSKSEVQESFKADLLQPVLDMAGVWFDEGSDEIIFHDPLAATTIFRDDICQFTKCDVRIEIEDTIHAGRTLWTPNENGAHEIALQVDRSKFIDEYFGTINNYNNK